MAPSATTVTIRLTEPVVFLTGGQEHERARARRRRAARQAANVPTAGHEPGSSRPGSRSNSRAPSPSPGLGSRDGAGTEEHHLPRFYPPGPIRAGRSMERRESPAPGGRSRSRAPPVEPPHEVVGLTTGGGTAAEAEEADEPPPAMLRGLLTLTLAKPSRIRDITVKLRGLARTDWPEGIGPRRLDVMEESVLLSSTYTFFSASSLSNERRAASMDPRIGEQDDEGGSRGRPSGRRAASMMPTRDSSVGLAYPSRDSAIHSDEPPASFVPDDYRRSGLLSRIPSSTTLETTSSENAPPMVEPSEPSPAYEVDAVPAAPDTPLQPPVAVREHSVDSFDLSAPSRRSPSLVNRNRFDFPATPSPLGPSRAPSIAETYPEAPLRGPASSRTSEEDLPIPSFPPSPTDPERPRLSHEPSYSSTTSSHSGPTSPTAELSDPEGRAASIRSSLSMERGRPPGRIRNGPSNLGLDATFSPPASPPIISSPTYGGAAGPSDLMGLRRTSSAHSGSSVPPPASLNSARRQPSVSSIAGSTIRTASAKPSARFSLAGLSEVFRGKSHSRARESSTARDAVDKAPGASRRAESPDTRRDASRGESRGRRTALKVIRSALTSDPDEMADEDTDDDGGDDDDPSGKGKGRSKGWKEFRAGTYSYPISIPIAASLPPSIMSEFGSVSYTLKATIHRAGALTPNLTATADVILVSCPGQDDTEENESIVVERFWETQMKYHIALSGKSFPIGGTIPISIRLNPMAKIKLYRVAAVLEQKTSYFASGRKLSRHETPKKYPLMRIEHKDPKDPLLPILSDSVDAIKDSPLADFFINSTSSDDTTPSCFDPIGPWNLESFIKLPDCSTRLNFSTIHDKANINVTHVLKIMLRVERGDDDFLDSKGKRKLWDVIIETPIHILSCRATQNVLPAYSSAPAGSTGSAFSTFGSIPDCGFDHSTNQPVVGPRGPSTMAALAYTATHGGRSSSTHRSPVTTLEQSLLFARLVAGEETPAGEVPPAYDAVLAIEEAEGRGMVGTVLEEVGSWDSDTGERGRTGRAESVPRGRSGSVVRARAASARRERAASASASASRSRGPPAVATGSGS